MTPRVLLLAAAVVAVGGPLAASWACARAARALDAALAPIGVLS